jgi:hypothetical protein
METPRPLRYADPNSRPKTIQGQDFWATHGASGHPDRGHLPDEHIRGFVEGALEVWGKVKDKL